MPPRSLEDRSLIDEFLRNHDFSARHEIRIDASTFVVYQCLLHADFSDLRLVRLLMTVRSGKRVRRNDVTSDLRQRLKARASLSWRKSRTTKLSSALRGGSGVPMAGAVSASLRVILLGFPVRAARRLRGISS
jgi:hypothetical protein